MYSKVTDDTPDNMIVSAREMLLKLRCFLQSISNEDYEFQNGQESTVGGHVRHVLEFFQSFILSIDSKVIDYDNRNRNKMMEVNREYAISILDKILCEVDKISEEMLSEEVTVKESVSIEFKASASSSFGRELMFLVSHLVHHMAIIKFMIPKGDAGFDDDFGKAPSTQIYEINN